jgi:hypothetical protein
MKIQKEFDVIQASTTVRIEKTREDVTPIVGYKKFISKGIEIDGEVVNQRLETVLPENVGTTLFQDTTANGVNIGEAVANTTAKATVEYAEKTGQRPYIEMKYRQPAERPADGPAPVGKPATPQISFSVQSGQGTSTNVTITCGTDGAAIYYTTDGSAPSKASTLYNAAFELTASATVKAIAYKDLNDDGEDEVSSVASKSWTRQTVNTTVNAPTISINNTTGAVTISSTTSGAEIRYTIDGSNPSATSGTVYSGSFTLADSATVKAIAYKEIDGAVRSSTVTTKSWTKPVNNNFTVYYGFAAKTGLDGDEELEDWIPLVSASDVTNTDEVTAVEKSSILGEYHIVANNTPGFTRMGIFAYPATEGSFKNNYNIADKSFPTSYLDVEEKTATINGTNYIIVIGVATNMAASGNDVIITRK